MLTDCLRKASAPASLSAPPSPDRMRRTKTGLYALGGFRSARCPSRTAGGSVARCGAAGELSRHYALGVAAVGLPRVPASVRFRLPAVRFVRVGVSVRRPLRMVCRPCRASARAALISLWVGVAVLTASVPAASGRRFGGFRWRVACPLVLVGCRPCCVPLLRLPASDVRRPVALPKREAAHPVKSAPLAASCGVVGG